VGDSGPSPPIQFSRTQQLTTILDIRLYCWLTRMACWCTKACKRKQQSNRLD